MLEALDVTAPARPRLWRAARGRLTPAYEDPAGEGIPIPQGADAVPSPSGGVLRPLAAAADLWIETPVGREGEAMHALLGLFLRADRESSDLSHELASRYEEIDLLYTLTDILGQALRLEDAAGIIVRAVSDVVGASRASLAVLDESAGLLRFVAVQGFDGSLLAPVKLSDPESVAARAVRDGEPQFGDAGAGAHPSRGYRSGAYMSVPIIYRAPGGSSRCVGVINLTDRSRDGRFTATEQKLMTAAANQIGAAIELTRMMARQREQQRLQDELEVAHHLQRSLLPSPDVLRGDADVAVRCCPAERVGGDFYSFNRLGLGLVGVMVGDVASHGISAAIVMAGVMSAAGIHAAGGASPEQTLSALRGSLARRLDSSETYVTIFYGVLDPINRLLTWANAGHPHAFRISGEGEPERLEATAPPIGLAESVIGKRSTGWTAGRDLLCIWTDGLVDAQNDQGERFGEARLLAALTARRAMAPELIVSEVMAEADAFAPRPADDRTLLVVRL